METNDPDDFLTLLFLIGHPHVNLKAVTIMPGSPQQVGIVRHVLQDWFGLDIPIGVHNLKTPKEAVSDWHYLAYGDFPKSDDALPAGEIITQYCDRDTTLIMGAPLNNFRNAIRYADEHQTSFEVGRLFVQGGFAGEGVVPSELQLEKFKGLTLCPTHNLMANRKATLALLEYPHVDLKKFVSKNVCHRVYYNHEMHEIFAGIKQHSKTYELIWQGMEVYLQARPEGKLLHDPLTACCAIDESIGIWREVEIFQEKNQWGAKLADGSGTWIIIDYDHEKFLQILTQY